MHASSQTVMQKLHLNCVGAGGVILQAWRIFVVVNFLRKMKFISWKWQRNWTPCKMIMLLHWSLSFRTFACLVLKALYLYRKHCAEIPLKNNGLIFKCATFNERSKCQKVIPNKQFRHSNHDDTTPVRWMVSN